MSKDGVTRNPKNENDYQPVYTRIGYARSEDDHAYDFDLDNDGETFLMSDSNVGSSTPIIESFLAEDNVSGTKKRTNGAGGPSVIESGDYYYLYYNRQITNADATATYSGSWPLYTTTIASATNIYWDCICAARAKANDVINEDYASLPNPWKKRYNGSWNSNGRGGYSTPTMGGTNWSDSWRAYPNVVYDNNKNNFYLICGGPLGLYLYESSDLSSGTWGTGLLIGAMENYAHYPSLIGGGGDDKEGSTYYRLFYAHSVDPQTQKTMRRRSITIN